MGGGGDRGQDQTARSDHSDHSDHLDITRNEKIRGAERWDTQG